MERWKDLLQALPLITYLDDAGLDDVVSTLAPTCVDILRVDVSQLYASGVLEELASGLAENVIPGSQAVLEAPLSELVPGLAFVRDSLSVGDSSMRLYNILGRHGCLAYASIARISLDQALSWFGMGVGLTRELLAHAILVGIHGEQTATGYDREPQVPAKTSDAPGESPVNPSFLGGLPATGNSCRPCELELVLSYQDVMERLPRRLRIVTERRLLALGERPTLEELGAVFNVTRERIRQLEQEASRRLRLTIAVPSHSPLAVEARNLAREIGSAFQIKALRDVRTDVVCTRRDGEAVNPLGLLLLWVGGPYRQRAGWLVRESRRGELAQRTKELVDSLLDGHSSRESDGVLATFAELGITESMRRSWLESVGGFKILDGQVTKWGSSQVQRAFVVLSLAKRPMSPDEIANAIGAELSIRSLKQRLADDSRFQRVGKTLYGLPEWGYDEYTTVSDEIAEEIERQGGAASLEHLVDVISSTYGVAESSIRAYASSRRFTRTRDGRLRIADPGEVDARVRPLELSRGCYRLTGRWSVRVKVTSETMRGSGTSVPECFVAHLGLKVGERRQFRSQYGDVAMSWGQMSAYVGSLRPIAWALNAAEGDFLFIEAVGDDRLEFKLVSKSLLEGLEADKRVAASVAWGGLDSAATPLEAVAHALGIDSCGTSVDTSTVSARLRARREPELLPVVGIADDTSDDLALEDFLNMLGD